MKIRLKNLDIRRNDDRVGISKVSGEIKTRLGEVGFT